jgi:pilus retraction protein PilT
MISSDIDDIARMLLSPEAFERAQRGEEVNTAVRLSDGTRLRLHSYHTRNGLALALRRIEGEIPSYDSLGLPLVLQTLAEERHGLFLIVGATGSGKTTTRAALVEFLNTKGAKYILILEDVAEYEHTSKRSLITQRVIGGRSQPQSYQEGLTQALREDLDVIVIGDLRDLTALVTALSAAQSGHLVIAEFHAGDTAQALTRMISSFPGNEQRDARQLISQHLIGVTAQRLKHAPDGNVMPSFEILINTPAVKSKIRDNRIGEIHDVIMLFEDRGKPLNFQFSYSGLG